MGPVASIIPILCNQQLQLTVLAACTIIADRKLTLGLYSIVSLLYENFIATSTLRSQICLMFQYLFKYIHKSSHSFLLQQALSPAHPIGPDYTKFNIFTHGACYDWLSSKIREAYEDEQGRRRALVQREWSKARQSGWR